MEETKETVKKKPVKKNSKQEKKKTNKKDEDIIYIVEEYSDPEDEEEVEEETEPEEIEERPKRKKKKRKHRLLKILIILILLWFLIRVALTLYYSGMNKQDYKKPDGNSAGVMSSAFVTNILIIGTDSRNLETDAGRSDCIMLLSVNRLSREITITSFLRDSYVTIPGYNPNRINAAYQFGGAPLLIQTIEDNYKISVDDYFIVDFFSCMDIIDAVGGVSIDVTGDEANYINMYLCEINQLLGIEQGTGNLTETGRVTLTGKQALAYSRIRYIGTDFARTNRQRTVLMAMIDSAKRHPVSMLTNMKKVFPEIVTSISASRLAGYTMELPVWAFFTVSQQHIPADGTWGDLITETGMDVLGIDFEANRKILWDTIYKKEYK